MYLQIRYECDDTDEHYAWNLYGLLLGLFASKAKALGAIGEANKKLRWEIEEVSDQNELIRIVSARFVLERRELTLYAAYDSSELGKVEDPKDALFVEPTNDKEFLDNKIEAYMADLSSQSGSPFAM